MIYKAFQAPNRGRWYKVPPPPETALLTVHKTQYDKHHLYSSAGKSVSFTRLPNFLFEAPTFTPLSNEAKVLYAFILRRTELSRKNGWADEYGRIYLYYPICEVVTCSTVGGRKRSTPCGNCNTPDWWKSRSRAVENPTAFTQNPMKRFQTPTSRNPVMVRRRTENRTHEVRKSLLLKYGNRTVYRNTKIKILIYILPFQSYPRYFLRDFPVENPGKGKERGKEFMAQHAILRFEKHKGNPARPLEAHHERQKEQYASNPDIDTSRSKYNFHIVKPEGRYYHFIQSRIEQARVPHPQGQHTVCRYADNRQPGVFQGQKSPKEIQAFFQRAADFLIGRVGRKISCRRWYTWTRKRPICI